MKMTRLLAISLVLLSSISMATAQWMAPIQYWRGYDKSGLNVFETTKDSGAAFTGLAVRIGGGFTQGYQMLSHENYVTNSDNALLAPPSGVTFNKADTGNRLFNLASGFNNASANLNIDAQLAAGVRLNLVLYLSSRHHNETWVKGGYIQFDELRFLNSSFLDDLMKYLTIRVGHMEVNYGDQHFRRSDGGSTIYNPFIENYIIDAFTTEIGGDIAFQSNGFLVVGGITNGEIKGNVTAPTVDTLTSSPAFYGKLGYDGKVNEDFRYRVTGSVYTQHQSPRNTLYAGDRTGSNYFMIMEKAYQTWTGDPKTSTASSYSSQFTSGRINPNLTNNVTAFQFNGFLQFGGLEFFGTYEMAQGASSATQRDVDSLGNRSMNQIAADLIYRFGNEREFYLAGRYNVVNVEEGSRRGGEYVETKSDRIAIAAGWYILPQLFLKAEYMMQNWTNYELIPQTPTTGPTNDYRYNGKASGLTIQAVVGF